MEKNYLSYRKVLKGKLMDLLEKSVPSTVKDKRSIKSFTKKADAKKNYTVELCQEDGNKILVKRLVYKNKNLKYQQIKNEAELLSLAMDFSKKYKLKAGIKFPRLIKLEEKNHEIILEREYLEGKSLSTFSCDRQIEILQICLNSLEEISEKVKDNFKFPKRTVFFQILTLPVYLTFAIVKEPKMLKVFFSLFFCYYLKRLRNWNSSQFVVAHRDLHPNNIVIYNENGMERIAVIDPEIVAYCERQTDLAIIARYYFKDIGLKKFYKLLSSRLRTREDINSFVSNSIFYTIQCIAVESKSDKFYENSKKYSEALLHQLPFINNIIKEKGLPRAGFWSTIFYLKFFQNS